MAPRKANELTVVDNDMGDLIPFTEELPDYLKEEKQEGLEALSGQDFKIPRIKLLQSNNPEVLAHPGVAIPGHFWHTGAKKDLGTDFKFICAIISKRVILWAPQNATNVKGIMAFSRNARDWDVGADQTFSVQIKNVKEPLTWYTGKDVRSGGLLEWGTFNPDDNKSPPAAQLSYEYLVYLPEFPDLSPVILGTYRTAMTNAKNLNTMLVSTRKPIQAVVVRAFAQSKGEGQQAWFVPNYETKGWANEKDFKNAKSIADKQKDYTTDEADYKDANDVPATHEGKF